MVIYYIFIIFGIFVAASMLKSKKKKKAKTKKKQKQNSKNWHFPLFPPTLYFLKPKKKKCQESIHRPILFVFYSKTIPFQSTLGPLSFSEICYMWESTKNGMVWN